MAFAIAGAVSQKIDDAVIIPFDIDEARVQLFVDSFRNVKTVSTAAELTSSCDVLFLSVKPQMMRDAITPLSGFSGLAISIAAGLKIALFEELLPEARIIRVMPNTPCLVGEMAAGYSAGRGVTSGDLAVAEKILKAAGIAVLVDEGQIDAVTGLSGSGPAYFARIVEAFIEAGISSGLAPALARDLALQTMKGTAALLQQKGMSPEELVTMVSSPNGTTVAGREILEASDYKDIISRTVERTVERSRELGK